MTLEDISIVSALPPFIYSGCNKLLGSTGHRFSTQRFCSPSWQPTQSQQYNNEKE
jgi:hypothetical protein